MNIPQLTALCLRYQGVLLDASEEVVHVAVVDAPSHELLDALHFATTKRIEITCWTRQQMEGHASRTQQTLPVAVQEKHQPKAEFPTKFGRTNYDELLSFQIIFNAFHTIYRFGDTFSTVALCLGIDGTGELNHAVGGFNFHMTGRDDIVRQQFGFDFTGGGGVTQTARLTAYVLSATPGIH